MQLVWRRIRESLEQHRRAALISVIKVDGSAPREVGARMVVQQDAGFFGTIGGGRLEYETLAVAEAALSAETPQRPCMSGRWVPISANAAADR